MEKSNRISDMAVLELERGEYTCVLTDGELIYTSKARGVKPLVRFIDEGGIPAGLYAADRVVGKATAYLYVILKIRELYARVISEPAVEVLRSYGISVSYGTLVRNIINRRGDGICPFEEAVLSIQDPTEAYASIRQKMNEMNIDIYE